MNSYRSLRHPSVLGLSTQALHFHGLKNARFALRNMASDANGEKLEDILQGDIWSKGFPKYYETYYLFQINPQRAKDFAQNLRTLANDHFV